MGAVEASSSGNGDAGAMEELNPVNPDWSTVADLLQKRSFAYKDRYGFSLRLKKLWKIRPSAVLSRYESEASELGPPTRLFHGTSPLVAQQIAKEGFKLPTKAGMFGAGIYFAETPLKSANFAPEGSVFPFMRRFVTKGYRAAMKKETGQMLLCDVHLGRCRTLRSSRNKLDPALDLQGGWCRSALGLGDYNSVYAPGGFFGAVRVSEYVIYTQSQAVPRYLIEFEYDYSR